jgi:hypothetical protein
VAGISGSFADLTARLHIGRGREPMAISVWRAAVLKPSSLRQKLISALNSCRPFGACCTLFCDFSPEAARIRRSNSKTAGRP